MSHAPLLVVPPRLFAPAAYYDLIAGYDAVYVDYDMRYNKRDKEVHRYDIADARGRLSLTVPVSHPEGFSSGRLRWSDIGVSAHGRWWEVQTVALESAYGGTPYFEYLFDSFRPLFGPRPVEGETIADLIRRANNIVRRIMGIRTYFLKTLPPDVPFDDYRTTSVADCAPYRQLRQDRLGFIPSLSILDRLFNEGH